MQIEVLNRDNTHLLDTIAQEVFDHPIDTNSLKAFLDCPRHIMVLAVDENEVVGMASGVEYFHPDKQTQLWINEVGVTPAKRNRGIGRALVKDLIAIAKQKGCKYSWLGTDIDNHAAQKCFDSIPSANEPDQFLLYEWNL